MAVRHVAVDPEGCSSLDEGDAEYIKDVWNAWELQVVAKEGLETCRNARKTVAILDQQDVAVDVGTEMELVLDKGSDVVVTAVVQKGWVKPGCIALGEDLRHSLHLVHHMNSRWVRYCPKPAELPLDLLKLELEVRRIKTSGKNNKISEVDGVELAASLQEELQGIIVAVGQVVLLPYQGVMLAAQVMGTSNLSEEEKEAALFFHCYRGRVTTNTFISVSVPDNIDAGIILHNCTKAPETTPARGEVDVYTNDGEWFPVKKQILRPCISFTTHVRKAAGARISVHVDVPCLIFDKVLIFLELQAQNKEREYEVDIGALESLLTAAEVLNNCALRDFCLDRLGDFSSRMRLYCWEEVIQNNSKGGVWIAIDGMVLDVKRWLPEHPGGQRIIPEQAKNVDSTTFFEVYHASRESFLYLKHFYIGEVQEDDLCLIPRSTLPSEEFLVQLREYTDFRISNKPAVETFKSF
uniref:Cytochrome b5 heme-binding domain-containing protein n=1 Tax=Picocystis salinarum TaxID=88271 RepID=A0A7S3UBV0_9CHLO